MSDRYELNKTASIHMLSKNCVRSTDNSACHSTPWEISAHSMVSVRAEEAWVVTRGSPNVTVVIIDDSFDRNRLPQTADVVSVRPNRTPGNPRAEFSSHGTLLAELIFGAPGQYPPKGGRARVGNVAIDHVVARELVRFTGHEIRDHPHQR